MAIMGTDHQRTHLERAADAAARLFEKGSLREVVDALKAHREATAIACEIARKKFGAQFELVLREPRRCGKPHHAPGCECDELFR